MKRRACAGIVALCLAVALGQIGDAAAQAPSLSATVAPVQGPPPAPAGQGIAVLAVGNGASDDAFALGRAVYGSRLRPKALDEVRARILAGGPLPPTASRELKELAEVRAGITTEDAAGRRLLAGLAQQVGAEALLVVRIDRPAPPAADLSDAGADSAVAPGNAVAASAVVARLFLVPSGDFDAARYSPDPEPSLAHTPAAWKSTVTSLEARFPVESRPAAAPAAALKPAPEKKEGLVGKSTPFYASVWFWGAIVGAGLLATAFYFASQDSGNDALHLQMRIPH